jgi:hypothetical protein
MDYYAEKKIAVSLQQGVASRVPATFLKNEEELILHLIANDMVKAGAFTREAKKKYGLQNLAEPNPVTSKGKALFGLTV